MHFKQIMYCVQLDYVALGMERFVVAMIELMLVEGMEVATLTKIVLAVLLIALSKDTVKLLTLCHWVIHYY